MRPGKHGLTLLLVLLALAIGVSLRPDFVWLWWFAAGLSLGLAGYEYLCVRRYRTPVIRREVAASLAIGVWSNVRLHLVNRSFRAYTLAIFDHYPEHAQIEGMPCVIRLAPKQQLKIQYRIKPVQRGDAAFSSIQMVLRSPLDICRQTRVLAVEDAIKVYPNFSAVAKYALLAHDNQLSQMGVRKRRLRGEGLDFHQLREYRQGDSLRQIDWKATSRLKKLISKEYQQERDQQIIFLLDCGRRMRAQDDAVSHFDHVLNAMLLLSYVGLRQGDAVGLMTFGTDDKRWLKPKKGASMINALLNTVYDLQPSLQSADYIQAAQQLMIRQQKRALVVVISNVMDDESLDILPSLRLLQKRHLVLLANLREKKLDTAIDEPVDTFADAIRHAATCGYIQARKKTQDMLQHNGALLLDVNPDQLAISLVNRYLEVKQSGAL